LLEVSLDTTLIPFISLRTKNTERKEKPFGPSTEHVKSNLLLHLAGVFKIISTTFSSDLTVIFSSKLYILQLGLFIICPSVTIL